MWTYALTYYLMLKLKTIIALASMTYIVELNLCKLFNGSMKCSMTNKDILLRVF